MDNPIFILFGTIILALTLLCLLIYARKNKKFLNISDGFFQAITSSIISGILVGLVVASASSYFAYSLWQFQEKKTEGKEKYAIARFMCVSIKREIKTSKQLIDALDKEKIKPGKMVPHGFKFLHDSAFYSSAWENIGILDEEIIIALDAYYRMIKSCQAMRDFMYEEIKRVNEDTALAKGSIDAYIYQVNRLIATGEKVLKLINEKYPQKDVKNTCEEFLPKVSFFELK
ncbi:MAG: hypothetical protein Q8L26_04685 [Candidatus Omnitrophota bacterium]|nr:hypothetical protein [Candidatus Omnitrophota bacterium]